MSSNEILEDLWQARDAHARRFRYDLEAIFNDLRKQQTLGKRKVVSFIETAPNESSQPTSTASS